MNNTLALDICMCAMIWIFMHQANLSCTVFVVLRFVFAQNSNDASSSSSLAGVQMKTQSGQSGQVATTEATKIKREPG